MWRRRASKGTGKRGVGSMLIAVVMPLNASLKQIEKINLGRQLLPRTHNFLNDFGYLSSQLPKILDATTFNHFGYTGGNA